mmetsp:Transcript_12479/g.19650  ORF Transcript_12479/g.19650 Transcript_12479/m.19650 type:complete len:155 (-) Transcript_12479:1709-2173(-)|eukprot:CAMPEP_0184301102 /NCGR_PEP_ID=MMETSP1049-20130417/11373_1 /TAXON_ID=77928 /ORGANISM="Proteomonas sulcata, Strain CCMP704" /LENGTH=154 /DNA_ID=CAMNT_0026612003 /DNA_START=65 /DNA_END=529 /DNA_ORIENTATION=-
MADRRLRGLGLLLLLVVVGFAAADGKDTKSLTSTEAGKLKELKAHVEAKRKGAKLSSNKLEEKEDNDKIGLPDTKKKEDGHSDGPSFSQIWLIREFFYRCFGYALITGICVLILGCCVTQPGCYVFDNFLDKDRNKPRTLDDDAERLPGDSSKN